MKEHKHTKIITDEEVELMKTLFDDTQLLLADLSNNGGDEFLLELYEDKLGLIKFIDKLLFEAGYTKRCENCNRLFKPYRVTQKYCSQTCLNKTMCKNYKKRTNYNKIYYLNNKKRRIINNG